jgi:hypothetical protein
VRIRWTDQAIADLEAVRVFIEQDSPRYGDVVITVRTVGRLKDFPQSGRAVPDCGFERIEPTEPEHEPRTEHSEA